MNLEALLAYGRDHHFNDIEWFDAPKPVETGLLAREVEGLVGFAEHGSGSIYALFGGRVFWLDSEGEQFAIAANLDEFVDALHFYAGALYDAMSRCQGASYVAPDARPDSKTLRDKFNAAWREDAMETLREDYEGYADFCTWAKQHGRAPAADLTDRLVALRPAIDELRKLAGSQMDGKD